MSQPDQLAEIEALLPQLSAALAAIRLDDTARRALDSLRETPRHVGRFEAYVDAIEVLDATKEPSVRSALYSATRQAEEVGEALEAAVDSGSIQDAAADFSSSLIPALGRLENAVTDYWRKVARDEFEAFAGPGALLEMIPATRPLGQDLKAAARRAGELAEHRAPASEFAATVRALMAAKAQLQSQLQAASGGLPAVDAFLDALTHNKATLRHLTPEVVAWLADNDALDAFAVRAAT